jgi:hypothetical protein
MVETSRLTTHGRNAAPRSPLGHRGFFSAPMRNLTKLKIVLIILFSAISKHRKLTLEKGDTAT